MFLREPPGTVGINLRDVRDMHIQSRRLHSVLELSRKRFWAGSRFGSGVCGKDDEVCRWLHCDDSNLGRSAAWIFFVDGRVQVSRAFGDIVD